MSDGISKEATMRTNLGFLFCFLLGAYVFAIIFLNKESNDSIIYSACKKFNGEIKSHSVERMHHFKNEYARKENGKFKITIICEDK